MTLLADRYLASQQRMQIPTALPTFARKVRIPFNVLAAAPVCSYFSKMPIGDSRPEISFSGKAPTDGLNALYGSNSPFVGLPFIARFLFIP